MHSGLKGISWYQFIIENVDFTNFLPIICDQKCKKLALETIQSAEAKSTANKRLSSPRHQTGKIKRPDWYHNYLLSIISHESNLKKNI